MFVRLPVTPFFSLTTQKNQKRAESIIIKIPLQAQFRNLISGIQLNLVPPYPCSPNLMIFMLQSIYGEIDTGPPGPS